MPCGVIYNGESWNERGECTLGGLSLSLIMVVS